MSELDDFDEIEMLSRPANKRFRSARTLHEAIERGRANILRRNKSLRVRASAKHKKPITLAQKAD